jgi:hypothetical protein
MATDDGFPQNDSISPGIGEEVDGLSVMASIASQLEQDDLAFAAAGEEEKRQRDLVRELRNKFDWFKKERTAYYDSMFEECYKTYRLQVPDERKAGEWRSKINVPYAFASVEDAVPHLMEGIWGGDRPFRLKASADDGLVDSHEKLLYWEISELMDLEHRWEEYQRQKSIYGTSAAYVGFRADYRLGRYWKAQKDPNGIEQKPAYVLESREIPEYVGPTFEVIDIYNLYPHPRATPTNLMELFWVQFKTKPQLEKMKRFKNLDKLTDGMSESANANEGSPSERGWRTGDANQNNYPQDRTFQVVTYFDDLNKKLVTFSYNGGVLLEETDYPFFHDRCPIVFDRYTELPLEFWGMGVIEPTLSLIHEGNSIRNQRRDNVNLMVNAMMEVRLGDIDDEEEELVFQPGGVIHSRTGESSRFLQPPNITGDSYQEEARVSADIARVTGLGGPISGNADPNVTSATGTSILQKAQLLRLSRAIKREALAFKEVISQILALNVQFLPLKQVFDVLGPLHFKDYADLDGGNLVTRSTVFVQPVGVYANEELMRQQFTNLLNILGGNPIFAAKVNWEYLLGKALRLHGVEDLTMALNKPKGLDVIQAMYSFHENSIMATLQPIPPAAPDDDYDTHMSAHQELLNLRPDLWQLVGQHMTTHEMAKAQALQQNALTEMQALQGGAQPPAGPGAPQGMAGPNGPGSAPGGARGGANPNRQPSAASETGLAHQLSRNAPRK